MKKVLTIVVILQTVILSLVLAGTAVSADTGYMRGDANCDGVVNMADANAIAAHIVGNIQLSPQGYFNAAAVTPDKMTIGDALFIAQYVDGQRNSDFNWITQPAAQPVAVEPAPVIFGKPDDAVLSSVNQKITSGKILDSQEAEIATQWLPGSWAYYQSLHK